MSTKDHTTSAPAINPQNPATWLKPGEPLIGADGRDWSWCYVWHKAIPGFSGYMAGADGSFWTGRVRVKLPGARGGFTWVQTENFTRMATAPKKTGYCMIGFWRDGKKIRMKAHSVILDTFVGPAPAGTLCRHMNGRPYDNRLSNLAWGTAAENNQDQIRHGTMKRGSRHCLSKLDESDIPTIRRLRREGMTIAALGKQYGVTDVSISCLCRRKTWTHVPDCPP